jgi:hypothetical protein
MVNTTCCDYSGIFPPVVHRDETLHANPEKFVYDRYNHACTRDLSDCSTNEIIYDNIVCYIYIYIYIYIYDTEDFLLINVLP